MYLNGLMQWIKDEGTHKKNGMVVDESEWQLSDNEPNVPQQTNGNDCGVFATLCADFISDDLPLRYSQVHMEQFRVKIAAAILRGENKYIE
jgi:sentrin-specific protease 1